MRNSKAQRQAKIEEAYKQLEANPDLKILTVAHVHGLNNKTLGNYWLRMYVFSHKKNKRMLNRQPIDWDTRGYPDKRPKNEDCVAYDEGCIEKGATEDRYVGNSYLQYCGGQLCI